MGDKSHSYRADFASRSVRPPTRIVQGGHRRMRGRSAPGAVEGTVIEIQHGVKLSELVDLGFEKKLAATALQHIGDTPSV
jgi:hypothetical protein